MDTTRTDRKEVAAAEVLGEAEEEAEAGTARAAAEVAAAPRADISPVGGSQLLPLPEPGQGGGCPLKNEALAKSFSHPGGPSSKGE